MRESLRRIKLMVYKTTAFVNHINILPGLIRELIRANDKMALQVDGMNALFKQYATMSHKLQGSVMLLYTVDSKPYCISLRVVRNQQSVTFCGSEHRTLPAGTWIVALGPIMLTQVMVRNNLIDINESASLAILPEPLMPGMILRADTARC